MKTNSPFIYFLEKSIIREKLILLCFREIYLSHIFPFHIRVCIMASKFQPQFVFLPWGQVITYCDIDLVFYKENSTYIYLRNKSPIIIEGDVCKEISKSIQEYEESVKAWIQNLIFLNN